MDSNNLSKWIEWEKTAKQYLYGATVSHRRFPEGIDHDHCELCWARFSDSAEDLKKGYYIATNDCWICEDCYLIFKDVFSWKTESGV